MPIKKQTHSHTQKNEIETKKKKQQNNHEKYQETERMQIKPTGISNKFGAA